MSLVRDRLRKILQARVRPVVAWYDFRVGAYWDGGGRKLYLLPLPMLGIVIELEPKTTTRLRPEHPSEELIRLRDTFPG